MNKHLRGKANTTNIIVHLLHKTIGYRAENPLTWVAPRLAETGTMFSLSWDGPYKPLPLGKLVLLGCKRDRRAAPRHPSPLAGILGLA
jgi:hypothetical protein